MKNNLEDMFSDDKLDRAIKKGKRRTAIRTIIISLLAAAIIFTAGSIANTKISLKMSNEDYASQEIITRLTVPNGYITSSNDTIGFLGGSGNYKIARQIGNRQVGNKPVILQERKTSFGIFKRYLMTRYSGGKAGQKAGEWSESYWENGYRKMIFFHPEIAYKEYKNDLAVLDKIPDGKIIEMALSLDKKYYPGEVFSILPNVDKSWFWADAFRDEDINRYKKQVEEYDAKANYINEYEVLGVTVRREPFFRGEFEERYSELLKLLQQSKYKIHNEIYKEMTAKGYTDPSKAQVLGVIVYGTKEELKALIGNPHIKASSIGVVTDIY